jgi:hypothetical protein
LEMRNGLAEVFNSFTRLLPEHFRLIEQTSHERPGPFAPAPLQDLRRYYEPVRRRAARRYSHAPPENFRLPGLSLSPPAAEARDGIATRLPTFPTKAADQAHAAFMPDTAWPVSGPPARLIPES